MFKRDGFRCSCGSKEKIEAHHIKSFYRIIKDNKIKSVKDARKCKELWNIKNGKTLCRKCHRKTDNYGKKSKLIN